MWLCVITSRNTSVSQFYYWDELGKDKKVLTLVGSFGCQGHCLMLCSSDFILREALGTRCLLSVQMGNEKQRLRDPRHSQQAERNFKCEHTLDSSLGGLIKYRLFGSTLSRSVLTKLIQ